MNATHRLFAVLCVGIFVPGNSLLAQSVAAPIANPDSFDVELNASLTINAPGVLANDEPVKGKEGRNRSGLSAQLVSSVTNGSLLFNQDGSFTYTPGPGFVGADAFTYFAEDGVASSNQVTVTLTVSESTLSKPVANDDAYTLDQDTILEVVAPGILQNDQKVTGKEGRNRSQLSAQLVADVAHGSLNLSSDGHFTYLPDSGFSGDDSFAYNVYDGFAVSGLATVSLTVADVNVAPTIAGEPNSIALPGAEYMFVPDANDADGDTLTFQVSGLPAWANFDPVTGTLSGVPADTDNGVYEGIRIGVTDGQLAAWTNVFEINVVRETGTIMTLLWQPPTSNTDGSPLLDLSGYKIYYWEEYIYPDAQNSPVVELTNPGLSAYMLELPWAGFWKVAITAYNVNGIESDLSKILPIMAE